MFSPQIILQFGGAEAGLVIFGVLIGLAIVFIPIILFNIMVSRLMKLIAPHNRRMSPGGAWLMLIPLFNLVWQFLMVNHIADSVAAEYRRRGLPLSEDRPAYNIGLWACILYFSGLIPIVGVLGAIASIVLRIVYWVKLAGYKAELERSGPWEQFAHLDAAYGQNYQQPNWNQPGYNQNPQQQPDWNQPGYNQNPPQQPNWNQPGYNPNQPQQPNWNQPPATPPQQNWTPPTNPQNPPPPPPPGNTGGIDLNKRD